MKKHYLIIYSNDKIPPRKTVDDHLYSFKRYATNYHYTYINARFGIPNWITKFHFDAVILHYTFLALRWGSEIKNLSKCLPTLKKINSPFVAIPQDEYAYPQELTDTLNQLQVVSVFTLCQRNAWAKIYSTKSTPTVKNLITVLAGYADEKTLQNITKLKVLKSNRPIDIGYRARKNPYWYGEPLFNKYEIGNKVKSYCQKNTKLVIDISMDKKDVFYGLGWIRFLANCKAILGTESGSNFIDPHRQVKPKVDAFMKKHPNATYKQVATACFKTNIKQLYYLGVGPRHFEAAMTKTCQILLEGKYSGILKPNIHYIPVKKDYSNLKEVIRKFQDENFKNKLISNSYRDLIQSRKYSYRKFALKVTKHLNSLPETNDSTPPILRNFKFGVFHILTIFYTVVTDFRIIFSQSLAKITK